MAIDIPISPAIGTGSGPVTSPSFSPPAGSLLVVAVPVFLAGTLTVSNTGTNRTWTQQVMHVGSTGLRIYTAPNPTALSNITVSAASSVLIAGGIKVWVVTGQHPSAPIGEINSGTTTTNNANVDAYLATQAGSRGFAAAIDASNAGQPTSTDEEWTVSLPDISSWGMVLSKAANAATGGEQVTFNLDAAGSAAADWDWIALEILPASLDATVDATVVEASADIPTPSITAEQNETVSPDAVTGRADIPTPSITAVVSATVTPGTVTASSAISAPNVVAGSAELVEPEVVTASADIPAPSILAMSNATASAAVVEGTAEVLEPAVTATFAATITPAVVEAQGHIPSPSVTVPILPGQFITKDGQVEWNGVIWGEGTSYRVRDITGWESRPQVDDLTVEEPARHGAFAGSSLIQRRIVQIKLQVDSIGDPTQVSGLLRQLRYDTRTLRGNALWPLVIRGYTETLLSYGKCIDRTGVMDGDYSVGAPEPVITIMCPDPRRYSLEQHSQVVPANQSSGTTLSNDGQLYTNPVLRFPGPAEKPFLYNETLDRILAFDITLTSGELLIVDTQLGTVKIGEDDYTRFISDTISVPIKEWFLDVGSSLISYETDSGGDDGVEVLWRDAHE